MRQNDKVQDSLLDTCYIYDVHKIYPSSEEVTPSTISDGSGCVSQISSLLLDVDSAGANVESVLISLQASDVEAASVGQAGYVYDLYCLDETEPGAETETIPTLKVQHRLMTTIHWRQCSFDISFGCVKTA
jgi:hypothetical protein